MYKIVKQSRINFAEPYRGKTCEMAGVKQGHIYSDLTEAISDLNKLNEANPIGFVILDTYNNIVDLNYES